MKRFVALVLVICCGIVAGASGQGLDDEYVQIFKLIQEGDALSPSAPSQALAKYLDAQAALDRLHKGSPEWNERIVTYRLSYLADRIAALSPNGPAVAGSQTNQAGTVATSQNTQPKPATPAVDWQGRVSGLQSQIGQLQSDKALLEAKLKEALAMRPAAAEPGQLAKAEERAKSLEKENELLKLSLEKSKQTAPVAPNTTAQDEARRSLVEANRQLSEQNARLAKLTLEKEALENRLKQSTPAATQNNSASVASANENARIRELERERDDLQKRLEVVSKEKSNRKRKGSASGGQDLETELVGARARLEILEARATPYTPEELELLKRPSAKLVEADPNAGKKSIKELPPGSAAEVAQAQRFFAAKQYDKAEEAYQRVLQHDPKNVPALGNLAAIQVEAEHFDQANANIKQALASDPDDAYSLYVLGILRFRQAKYDEALEALSRSAKLDPQNAEVQNYLGLALSEKGLRAPAEAALRKAIQLQPSYAGAHYNLAVVYATQQPPATELARWHYQKALAGGHPPNADLEKKFQTRQ